MLNRDLENEQELELNWHDLTPSRVIGFETITGNDLKALNTFADPKKVVPQTVAEPVGRVEDEREAAGAVVFGSDACRCEPKGLCDTGWLQTGGYPLPPNILFSMSLRRNCAANLCFQ